MRVELAGRARLQVERLDTRWRARRDKAPEGTEFLVFLQDAAGDGLDDEECAALHASLDEGMADADTGRVVDASTVLAQLRARSSPS